MLRKLSCAARANGIYVIVYLGEIQVDTPGRFVSTEKDVFHYNTNVVFNRKGEIVAKYVCAKL